MLLHPPLLWLLKVGGHRHGSTLHKKRKGERRKEREKMASSSLLHTLGYQHSADAKDKKQLMQCVCWLEDRKIRELEIAERENLRNPHDFNAAYTNYLERLGCPFVYDAANATDTLAWLISHAISVEYEDSSEACKDAEDVMDVDRGNNATAVDDAADENARLHQEQLDAEVDKLGSLLQVNRLFAEDTADFIIRLNKFIRFTLKPMATGEGLGGNEGEKSTTLAEFSAGFDAKDELINQISVVLKMLYIWDFRELQTDLNAMIVLGQEYTANPKTNTTLGKVGR